MVSLNKIVGIDYRKGWNNFDAVRACEKQATSSVVAAWGVAPVDGVRIEVDLVGLIAS